MPEPEHVWAKLYLNTPNDSKLVGRTAHECYLWVCLIILAKDNAINEGHIPKFKQEPKYLAQFARITYEEVVEALRFFAEAGMIAVHAGDMWLPNFARRQGNDSATSTERMRRLRERRSKTLLLTEGEGFGENVTDVTSHVTDVTRHSDAHVTPISMRRESKEERRESKEEIPPNPPLPSHPSPNGDEDSAHGARQARPFDVFWDAFPANPDGYKSGKPSAGRAWNRHVNPDQVALVMTALGEYAKSERVSLGFVSPPADWLESDWHQWLDKPKTGRNGHNGATDIDFKEVDRMVAERRKARGETTE